MKIVPDEVPEAGEAAIAALALAVDPAIPLDNPTTETLKSLNGKNVFVQFKNGSSAVGLLNTNGDVDAFRIGWRESRHLYKDVESFKTP